MSQGHKGVGKGPSSTRGSVTEEEGAAPMWKGWVSVQVTLHMSPSENSSRLSLSPVSPHPVSLWCLRLLCPGATRRGLGPVAPAG